MRFNGTTISFSSTRLRAVLVSGLLLGGLFAGIGCNPSDSVGVQQTESQAKHHRIAVTNVPLFCAVKTICEQAGSPVQEVIYCGPQKGDDPHAWIPSLQQIRDLQRVDLIVCNGPGAPFSTWLDKVTLDEDKILRTTDAMDLEEFVLVNDYQLVHSHGPEGEHSHAWVVPQSWLSARIARKQAKHCFERIVAVYGQSQSLKAGFANLLEKFAALEEACEGLRELRREFVVATSSPEVSYLTRTLGWRDCYLPLSEDRSEAEAETMLEAMRVRMAKQDSDTGLTEVPAALFLWAGQATESLHQFVEQQWEAAAEIDLIETPSEEGLDSSSYFERMTENLKVIRAAIE